MLAVSHFKSPFEPGRRYICPQSLDFSRSGFGTRPNYQSERAVTIPRLDVAHLTLREMLTQDLHKAAHYNFHPDSHSQTYVPNSSVSSMDIRSPHEYPVDPHRGLQRPGETSNSLGDYAPNQPRPVPASNERAQFGDNVIFGDMSNLKPAGAQQINDVDGNRVRVPRQLTTDVAGITPDWRSKYAIFPRSNSITSGTSPILNPNDSDDSDEEAEGHGTGASAPPLERVPVPLRLMNGFEATMEVPKMTSSRRTRERVLNEMGFRMSWGRRREFSTPHQDPQIARTLFLQRACKLLSAA